LGLVCTAWKISPPLGFDPWTVQPIANRYANCFISDTSQSYAYFKTGSQFDPPMSMIQFVVILQSLQVSFQFTFHKPMNFLCQNSICLLLDFIWTMLLCNTPVCI
jgi:hypothetical protein